MPVRLGLIGAGRWGRAYLRTIAALPEVRLLRVASGNPETAGLVPPGCRVVPEWRAVAEASDLDGVIVATPPALHVPMALAAVEAGHAVLVEKPLAFDPDEARRLQAAAARTGSLVLVDHVHLYSPAFRRLRERLADIGPVRFIRGRAGNHGPYRTDASVLWDWGPHDVAMCLALVGEMPNRIDARRLEAAAVGAATAELLELSFGFGGGATAVLRIGTLMDKCRWLAVEGPAGCLVYDDLAAARLVFHAGGTAREPGGGGETIVVPGDPPLACAVRAFAAAIRSGDRSDADLKLGVAVVDVLARCAERLQA